MAVDIVMPQMGESIFEGTITKWLKKPGDKVERDEPLFEISTDKVDAEIPSPSAGVLKEIKVAEGKTVPIQTVVGVIDAAGDASAAKPAQPTASPKSEAQPAKAAQTPPSRTAAPPQAPVNGKGVPAAQPQARPQPAAASASAPTTAARDGGRIHSSPLVRRMAKEHGIDLSGVTGTGAGGRISKQDIEALIAGGGQQRGATEDQTDQSGYVEEELEEAFNPLRRRQRDKLLQRRLHRRGKLHHRFLRKAERKQVVNTAGRCTPPSNRRCPAKRFILAITKCNP